MGRVFGFPRRRSQCARHWQSKALKVRDIDTNIEKFKHVTVGSDFNHIFDMFNSETQGKMKMIQFEYVSNGG